MDYRTLPSSSMAAVANMARRLASMFLPCAERPKTEADLRAADRWRAQVEAEATTCPSRPRSVSCTSEANQPTHLHQSTSLRSALPQILACLAINSFYLPDGAALGYSGILIPQLEKPGSEISITLPESAWLTSVMILVVPVGEALAVVFMEYFGRVNAVKISLIPYVLGCAMLAVANGFPLILTGRVLMGLSLALGTSPASIYVTEVMRPDLRGALIIAGPMIGAAGLVLVYIKGFLLHWRTVAWVCCAYAAIPLVLLTFFCPESPTWLVQKGRIDHAKAALKYFTARDECQRFKGELAEKQLQQLIRTRMARSRRMSSTGTQSQRLRGYLHALLVRPSGRRPLIIVTVLLLLQQFSGSYVTFFYAVNFFQDVKSTALDSNVAAIVLASLRFFMTFVSLDLLRRFGRRPLLIASASAMALCFLVSGYFTLRLHRLDSSVGAAIEHSGVQGAGRWVPVVCVLLYVAASCVGVIVVPWILAAELFSGDVRGSAQAITLSLAHLFMFAALQSYRALNVWLKSYGVQWLYASVCALTALFTWIVLPETQGRTVQEIEDYFSGKTTVMGGPKLGINATAAAAAAAAAGPGVGSIKELPDVTVFTVSTNVEDGLGSAVSLNEVTCSTRL